MALEGDVVLRCLVQGPDNVYELDLRHHNGIWVYRLWSMKQKPGKRMKPLPKGWMKNPELLAQFTKKFLAHLGLGEEGETLTEQPLLVWRYDAEAKQNARGGQEYLLESFGARGGYACGWRCKLDGDGGRL